MTLDFPLPFVPGAALFDCDGTLADTMPLHYAAWRKTLDPLGYAFAEETFYAWGGVTTVEIIERLNEQQRKTHAPSQVARAKEALYQTLIARVTPITVVISEVERLHGKCPLAVASGGMRHLIDETLATLGIAHYFDAIVTFEDVRRGKPEPDTFLLAAQQLGVAPTDCVVYEDAEPGLEAARRAGMRAIDVRPHIGRRGVP